MGTGVFINAPLKTIEVPEEYLERYKFMLSSNSMIGAVVELPILQAGEDRYVEETNLEINLEFLSQLYLLQSLLQDFYTMS
ncbi:hypothetical protein CMALT394_630004 [Carnobacterium maltaromaticum]|nr:hypothetical protein CMALT394_630004 [Carnobacterium maltaromaticum]